MSSDAKPFHWAIPCRGIGPIGMTTPSRFRESEGYPDRIEAEVRQAPHLDLARDVDTTAIAREPDRIAELMVPG
ncbi:hypothetical protein [Xanthomonas medicagonis]|uniref:hypothetical protein n=1 Tax=Xanthomonas medicagonis TaxID=3160841 RepID=UPI0035199C07